MVSIFDVELILIWTAVSMDGQRTEWIIGWIEDLMNQSSIEARRERKEDIREVGPVESHSTKMLKATIFNTLSPFLPGSNSLSSPRDREAGQSISFTESGAMSRSFSSQRKGWLAGWWTALSLCWEITPFFLLLFLQAKVPKNSILDSEPASGKHSSGSNRPSTFARGWDSLVSIVLY